MKTCVSCEANGLIEKATKSIVDSFGSEIPLCDDCYDNWLMDSISFEEDYEGS
jgi:hypothetical protein